MIALALKVFDQGKLVDECCTQDTEDARKGTELAQRVLAHCNRAGFEDNGYRNRERRGDARLKHLAQDISDAMWVYNELLEANPPG